MEPERAGFLPEERPGIEELFPNSYGTKSKSPGFLKMYSLYEFPLLPVEEPLLFSFPPIVGGIGNEGFSGRACVPLCIYRVYVALFLTLPSL